MPTSETVLYLWNKVRTDNMFKREGTYEISTSFINRLKLSARFRYELHDDGIETELLNAPMGISFRSRITVKALGAGRCEIEISENLKLPFYALLVKPIVARVQRQLARRELKAIVGNASRFFALPAA